MVQIDTTSFEEAVEKRKQEEAERKAALPSKFAKLLYPQSGDTVFFTVVVASDEEANDLDNLALPRKRMFRETQMVNDYNPNEPRWTDRALTPVIIGKADKIYQPRSKKWVLGENEMAYMEISATAYKQIDQHFLDSDLTVKPLVVTSDGIVMNRDEATAFKMRRDDGNSDTDITKYTVFVLGAEASNKYVPETVDVAPEDFDGYLEGYENWQQEKWDAATGNTSNDSENTADTL